MANTIQILRGSRMDPYILNRRPDDPYDGGKITPSKDFFVQTLDEYLSDFLPDDALTQEVLEGKTQEFTLDSIDPKQVALYRERVKYRCIAVIEYGIHLYKQHLNNRAGKLYIPAIEAGGIPDDKLYQRYANELRFEDEGRFERFFTEAIRKAIAFVNESDENRTLFEIVAKLKPETLSEFLVSLSEDDKKILSRGITENLKNALLRIEDLYEPAIKQGSIPNSPDYNKRITELRLKDIDELRERLFYFLRNSLCLTNWNEDDALRSDERAFRSCLD